MTIISRPLTLSILSLTALTAGLLGGPGNAFDVATVQWLADIRHSQPQLTSFIAILTQLGSFYATLGLGVLAAVVLFWRGQRGRSALLLAAVASERLIMDGLKLAIGRARPSFETLPFMPASSSFPSGHSGNSMAVFVAVALIAAPAGWRRAAFAAAVLASLLVGLTRPYLGVHWPSDVIGGWAIGLVVAGLAVSLGRRSGVPGLEPQHEIVRRHGLAIEQDQPS